MEVMMKQRVWVGMALLLLLSAVLLCITTGCEEDEMAKMARQQQELAAQRQTTDSQKPAATKPAGMVRTPNAMVEGEEPAAEGDEPAVEEYTGPKINVNILENKAPYPEYDGKGRYTVKIEVSSDELLQRSVWDILFFDAEGNQVASDRQQLKIPLGDHPMVLKFSRLFCMSQPAAIELRQTDYDAVAASEPGESAGKGGAGDAGGGKSAGAGRSSGGGSSSSGDGGGGGEEFEGVDE